MHSIEIKNIFVNNGEKAVLDNVSVNIHQGETFCLVGGNGAGKTTLLKSILDFTFLKTGHISILGVDHQQAHSRDPLAFLPEQFSPPAYLTGQQFLQTMAHFYQASHDTTALSQEIADSIDFDRTALKRSVQHYSKGMRQKLGLISIFNSKKKLLLLDEPLSGLDPKARILINRQLQSLKLSGTTTLMCTHMLNDVELLCDRIGILHNGAFRFIGTPQACCSQYNASSLEEAYLNCLNEIDTALAS